ncbi:MAG: cytochrome c biogenesis heme-transporting ATPase CcmA [Pseudomonadales bacterium]
MSEQAATLELRALACERGARLLFEGIEQRLAAGDALRVSGANGSGKTSLLRVVAGLTSEFSGEVRWRGADTRNTGQSFRAELLYLGHAVGVKAALSPRENLQWWADLQFGNQAQQALNTSHAIADALAQFGLGELLDTPCARLSAGQQRRVALARLVLARQPLWILDEPATALDRDGVTMLEQLCATQLQRGGLLLLTTHQPMAIPGMAELNLDAATAGRCDAQGVPKAVEPDRS